jgi:hypothetical protein
MDFGWFIRIAAGSSRAASAALADSIHARGGKIDLAILGYLQMGFKDELPDMPTAPLFEALRDLAPNTRGIEPLYRSPICVNTKTDESFVGYYAH